METVKRNLMEIFTLKKLTFWHKRSGSDWSIFKGMNTILVNGRHLKKADTLVNKGQMQNISHTEIGCPYLYLENKTTVLGGVGAEM